MPGGNLVGGENDSEKQESKDQSGTLTSGQSAAPGPEKDKLMYRKLEEEEAVPVIRCCATPEVRHSIYANPSVFSILSGAGVFAFLEQVTRPWPSARMEALPYLIIPASLAGMVGFGIGIHSLYHPKDEYTNPFKRSWFAILEGVGVILVFMMGEQIILYCTTSNHLNDDEDHECMVSEAIFWERLFPAPAILGAAYAAWEMVPLKKKAAWMTRGTVLKAMVILADSLAYTLLYSRIFQALATNIYRISQPLWYELAIPAAMIVLLFQTLKPLHSEKVRILMRMCMAGNLMAFVTRFSIDEVSSASKYSSYWWAAISQFVSFGSFLLTGLGFTVCRSRRTVLESRKIVKWIPAGEPQLLLNQLLYESLQQRPEFRRNFAQMVLADKQMLKQFLEDKNVVELLCGDEAFLSRINQMRRFRRCIQSGSSTDDSDLEQPEDSDFDNNDFGNLMDVDLRDVDLMEPLSPRTVSMQPIGSGGTGSNIVDSLPSPLPPSASPLPILHAFNASRASESHRGVSATKQELARPQPTMLGSSQQVSDNKATNRNQSFCSVL